MGDEELIKFGKYARSLAGIRVSGLPDPYKIQLDEARAEWRRRYPKQPTSQRGCATGAELCPLTMLSTQSSTGSDLSYIATLVLAVNKSCAYSAWGAEVY